MITVAVENVMGLPLQHSFGHLNTDCEDFIQCMLWLYNQAMRMFQLPVAL